MPRAIIGMLVSIRDYGWRHRCCSDASKLGLAPTPTPTLSMTSQRQRARFSWSEKPANVVIVDNDDDDGVSHSRQFLLMFHQHLLPSVGFTDFDQFRFKFFVSISFRFKNLKINFNRFSSNSWWSTSNTGLVCGEELEISRRLFFIGSTLTWSNKVRKWEKKLLICDSTLLLIAVELI